jgi:hypothetical protein
MRDEGVRDRVVSAGRSLIDFLSASIQGCQTAQSRAETSQYACKSRRKRSCYQSQNGMCLSPYLSPP